MRPSSVDAEDAETHPRRLDAPDSTRALPRRPATAEDDEAKTHVVERRAASETAARSDGPALRAGNLIDRYLVLGHIGSGGLGDVYAAYDTELERKIAIKLLRTHAGPAATGLGDLHARALREAQALARLRHPNVVTVYDVGTHEEEIFLAMELVDGLTISGWLQARDRNWREIRDVFVQAGRGLAAAHAAGLVHRDFKLGNVLVGADGRVVVLDFGLARALDVGSPATDPMTPTAMGEDAPSLLLSGELTDTRMILGTPQYLAPELWNGQPATARSDIFAFCVALYRCLYGMYPFAAKTAAEHRQAAIDGRIEPPPSRHGVPAWLHRAVVRGLQGDPQRRFDSVESLLEVLTTDRRRRRRWITSIAVAVPLLSTTAALASFALRPEPTAQEIDAARRIADEARGAAARGHYVYPPADSPDAPTAIAKVLELEAMPGANAETLSRDLRAEMADALVALGDRYFERPGGPPFAVDFYAAALVFDPDRDYARERVTLTPGQLADLSNKAVSGEFTPAELVAAEPLAVLADADDERRAEKVRRYFAGREDAAISTRERLGAVLDDEDKKVARSARPSTPAPADDGTIEDRVVPVATEVEAPPAERAAPVDERSAAEATSGGRDPQRALQALAEGRTALAQGDLSTALAAFNRALKFDRGNTGALLGLGELHYERGEYHKARTFAKRATAVSPRSGRAWILLGDACFKVLDYDAARDAYTRAAKAGVSAAQSRLQRLDKVVGE